MPPPVERTPVKHELILIVCELIDIFRKELLSRPNHTLDQPGQPIKNARDEVQALIAAGIPTANWRLGLDEFSDELNAQVLAQSLMAAGQLSADQCVSVRESSDELKAQVLAQFLIANDVLTADQCAAPRSPDESEAHALARLLTAYRVLPEIWRVSVLQSFCQLKKVEDVPRLYDAHPALTLGLQNCLPELTVEENPLLPIKKFVKEVRTISKKREYTLSTEAEALLGKLEAWPDLEKAEPSPPARLQSSQAASPGHSALMDNQPSQAASPHHSALMGKTGSTGPVLPLQEDGTWSPRSAPSSRPGTPRGPQF